jgi:hypothetical protein
MRVRLIVKLAETVNGVDLSLCHEGDVIELSAGHAAMLIREGWAEHVDNAQTTTGHAVIPPSTASVAEDRPLPSSKPRRRRQSSGPTPRPGDV